MSLANTSIQIQYLKTALTCFLMSRSIRYNRAIRMADCISMAKANSQKLSPVLFKIFTMCIISAPSQHLSSLDELCLRTGEAGLTLP